MPRLSHRTISTTSALLFVLGCLAFYIDALYDVGVTLFLAGSVMMLLSSLSADARAR